MVSRRVRLWAVALLCCAAGLLLPGAAQARKLFGGALDVDGELASTGTNKLRNVPDLFDGSVLGSLFPGYDPLLSDVAATIDLRGVALDLSFVGTELVLDFPAAGVTLSFDALDRDGSLQLLRDWLDGDFDDPALEGALTSVLQAFVSDSPVDPVAGNPNSLLSRMFAADWEMGTRSPMIYGDGWFGRETPNLVGLGADAGFTSAGPWSVYSIDLPMGYAVNWDRLSLFVDVPLAATSTEGAWTVLGSGGLGLQIRPFSWWALTPAARVGGVGSLDVGGLAVMYSGSLTSQLRFPIGPVALGIGNMAGVARTIDEIEIAGVPLSYDLTSYVIRNGGYLEGEIPLTELIGAGIGWRVFGSDVRFFGSDLYMDSYFELGASLGWLAHIGHAPYDRLGFQVSYLGGRNTDGVRFALGGRF